MEQLLIEVCCGSAEDVLEAEAAGAARVELNANLFQGGLTPTVGMLMTAKRHTKLSILCMVRPREGGFCYTDTEFETMLADAAQLLGHGADGLVFGILHEDGTVDEERCGELLELCQSKEAVFHRAIDVTPDWRDALDAICRVGFTRVLTSGQMPGAPAGAQTICAMREYAAGRVEILPGAGINPANAALVAQKTGCCQLHLSGHKVCYDRSAGGNPAIHFGGALYPPEDCYKMIDREYLKQLTGQLSEQ